MHKMLNFKKTNIPNNTFLYFSITLFVSGFFLISVMVNNISKFKNYNNKLVLNYKYNIHSDFVKVNYNQKEQIKNNQNLYSLPSIVDAKTKMERFIFSILPHIVK